MLQFKKLYYCITNYQAAKSHQKEISIEMTIHVLQIPTITIICQMYPQTNCKGKISFLISFCSWHFFSLLLLFLLSPGIYVFNSYILFVVIYRNMLKYYITRITFWYYFFIWKTIRSLLKISFPGICRFVTIHAWRYRPFFFFFLFCLTLKIRKYVPTKNRIAFLLLSNL